MGYLGDQEHWYGPGKHLECKKLTADSGRCGFCKDCNMLPRGSLGCDEHARVKDAPDGNKE